MALARAGARTAGLDISGGSVDAARRLATDCGLEIDYRPGNVYDAVEVFGAERFDLVYTGKGALCWLPDLKRWAARVAGLLRPGGVLYLVEFHPVLGAAADEQPDLADGVVHLRYDYSSR